MDDTTIDTTIDTGSHTVDNSGDNSGNDTSAGTRPEALVDELLVEEISIDGMCGVY